MHFFSSICLNSTFIFRNVSNVSQTTTPAAQVKPPRHQPVAEEITVEDSPGNPFLDDEPEEDLDEKTSQTGEELDKSAGDANSKRESADGKSNVTDSNSDAEPSVVPTRSPRMTPKVPSENPPEDNTVVSAGDPFEEAVRKVKASHKYVAIEDDELAFEKGDIIEVLPWLSDEDAEEGWLRGRRESDGKCGVFPENHTKPL